MIGRRFAECVWILSTLSGCMPNQSLSTATAAEHNIINLSRVAKGMTQLQVLKIMRHPFSDAVFHIDNDTYDVWFYVTEPTVLGQSRMVPMNLTPLTFKNGILIGWGYLYYNALKQRQLEADKASVEPNPLAPPKVEDKKLEKVLEQHPSPSPSQQQPLKTPPSSQPNRPAQSPQKGTSVPPHAQQTQPTPKKKEELKKGAPSSQPPSETAPNWSPLEPQSPQQQPPQQPPPSPSAVSMSRAQKSDLSAPKKSRQSPEEKTAPLNEGDDEMLQEERQEDFDQTG